MAELSCSFCGKGQHEVARLVSGPRVFICNECVILCNEIIAEGPGPELNEGAMDNVRQLVARIATTNVNVLFHGPPGAGKSFLARTIHRLSGSTGELFTVNCDGPEVELEVGLFGCERNALRATPHATMGALEAANRGTVFLRRVLSLPKMVQAKLLRAIEDREVFRVGGIQPRPIDARFISATRQDPDAALQAGAFRSDLFFRLNGITLDLPPLRRRREEIPALVHEFLEDFRRELGRPALPRIAPEAMESLRHYPWPGNVAQLRAVVRRALLLCEGAEISAGHLTIEMPTPSPKPMPAPRAEKPNPVDEDARRRILEALAAGGGSAVRKHPPRELRLPKPPEPRCSICDRLKTRARMLFHGSSAFICDGCVAEAQVAIAAHTREAGAADSPEAGSAPKRADVGCAFCGKCEAEIAHLVGVEDHQLICDRCLDAYDHSLAEQFSADSWRGRTFALRSAYSAKKIDDVLFQAREDLARGRACRLVVLAESGDPDAARGLLDRAKGSLVELADVWEPTPDRGVELTAVAFPRPARRA